MSEFKKTAGQPVAASSSVDQPGPGTGPEPSPAAGPRAPGFPLPPAKVQAYADENGVPPGARPAIALDGRHPSATLFEDVAAGVYSLSEQLRSGDPNPDEWSAIWALVRTLGATADAAAQAFGGNRMLADSNEWMLSPAAYKALTDAGKGGTNHG